MPLYEIDYRVTGPVDQHPMGSRTKTLEAPNHLLACHAVRLAYGEDKAQHVVVDGVRLAGRDLSQEGMPHHPWLLRRARAS